MDVQESFRTLELEIGASRADVDAAYCRLLERWHPGRAAAKGSEAVQEAQRMVQAINEAYNTLSAVAPTTAANSSLPQPATPGGSAGAGKPRLTPLSPAQAAGGPPPPKPPPAQAWASRTAPPEGAPPSPAPPPPAKTAPPPAPKTPPASIPAAPAEEPSPALEEEPFLLEEPKEPSKLAQAADIYDKLFPVGTPRRRIAPIVAAVAMMLLLLLAKCTFFPRHRGPREPDPKTTGRLVVKSNLAAATIEAKRIPSTDDASVATFTGTPGQTLAGLPPGKYAITASADGWKPIQAEAALQPAQVTQLTLNFKGGSLRLDSDPAGAAVRMGDNDLGKTPLTIPMLPPGECTVSVQYGSWPAIAYKTTIVAGVDAAATVRLPHGKLTVDSSPSGATVIFGRQTLGVTPLTIPQFPAGTWKLSLQTREFPPLVLPITVADNGEVAVHPALGLAYPELDPTKLLRFVWVSDNRDVDTIPFDGTTGPSAPHNGYIHNLNRKRLYNDWMQKHYRATAMVKAYNKETGEVEFAETDSEFCRYHLAAKLGASARNDPEIVAQLTKGATFTFYGRLTAVEESRWGSKSVTFELSNVEALPAE